MCFASGGGGSSAQTSTRSKGPLTAVEEEQRRSESAAWASRERGSPYDPYKLMPRSRQAKLNEPMNRQGARTYANAMAIRTSLSDVASGTRAPQPRRPLGSGFAEMNTPERVQQRTEMAQQANLANYNYKLPPNSKPRIRRG